MATTRVAFVEQKECFMTFDGPCFTVLSLLFLGVIEIKLSKAGAM